MNGKVATTPRSKETDNATRVGTALAVKEINDLYGLELTHFYRRSHPGLGKTVKKGSDCAIQPDGGFVYDGDVLVMTTEAKNNKESGNAIERWYHKVFVVRKFFNKDASFVTFAAGVITEVSPIYTKLHPAHSGDDGSINVFTPNKNSLFLREVWTTEEVKEIVKESLIKALNL
jgi:hypothetical protein